MVQKLNAAANQVLSSNEIGKVLAADGAMPAGGTPAALAAFHKADYDKWGEVMAKAGIGKK
ncbi:hypothetical protein D3C83_201760 [compost metagenome]